MEVRFQGLKDGKEWEYYWTGVIGYEIKPYGYENFCKEYPNDYTGIRDVGIERNVFDNIVSVTANMTERMKNIVYKDDIEGKKKMYLTFIRYFF